MKESSSMPLELNALHLPSAPSWWPLAWGWWAMAAAIVTIVVVTALIIRWKRKRMAPKKAALRLLGPQLGQQTPSAAIELLRQTALCYYPREEIAHLTGQAWYAFLDAQVAQPIFAPKETLWQQALYQKQPVSSADALVSDCYQWVNDALPPKKRRTVSIGKP